MPPQYQYGPPPAWAAQANSQAPHWAQYNKQYNPYQNTQPFIPPPPQQSIPPPPQQGSPPQWYPGAQPPAQRPGWVPDAYGRQPPPPPQEPLEDPTTMRSKKWPRLNAILATDTSRVRFKVSGNKPSQEIFASTFYMYRNVPANATPTTHMRIFSKQFPWSIEINLTQDITCSIVWNAIWASLQEPILDSEWGLLCASGDAGKKRAQEIVKANKRRLELNSYADKRILRCDYMGENAWFLGLERDEDFQSLRSLPGSDHTQKPIPEDTWLVKMGK